jgi:hypothetical protein
MSMRSLPPDLTRSVTAAGIADKAAKVSRGAGERDTRRQNKTEASLPPFFIR